MNFQNNVKTLVQQLREFVDYDQTN